MREGTRIQRKTKVSELVQVTFRLPKDRYRGLRVYLAKHGVTATSVFSDFVDTLIKGD